MFDNQLIKMGDGEDFAIYHDTTVGNVIKSNTSDMDIVIQGNDGGSTITALTLDMSAGGNATFNGTITSTGLTIDNEYTLPSASGSAGQVLKYPSTGSQVIWADDDTQGTTINNNADNRIITGSGTANTLNAEANFTYDGSKITTTSNSALGTTFTLANTNSGGGREFTFISNSTGNFYIYDDTANTTRFTIDSAGRVGIGTTSATAPLSIGSTGSLGAISNNYQIATSIDGGFSTANARQHKVIGFIGTTAGITDIYDSSYASGERSKNFYSGLFTDNSYFNASSYRIVQGGKSRLTIKQDSEFVINDDSIDRDFRVESDNNAHALFVQGSDGNIGIGTGSLIARLHVKGAGNTSSTNAIFADNSSSAGIFAIRDNGDAFILGNTGIGTSSPASALHIGNAGHILLERGGELRSKDTGGAVKTIARVNGSNELQYGWSSAGAVTFMGGGSYTERMRIHTDGNIAIGTSSPTERLTVLGNQNITGKLAVGASAAHGSFDFYNQNTAYFNGAVTIDDNLFVTSGNVGIGTSSPSANLEITQSGNNVGLLVAGGGYNYTAKFESVDAEANIIIEDNNSTNDGNMIGVATNDMYFITDTAERMRIDSSGKVGIGTSSPSLRLHSKDTGNYQLDLDSGGTRWRMGAGWSGYYQNHFLLANTTDGIRMAIDTNGKVGIGTALPSHKLTIEGTTSSTTTRVKTTTGNAIYRVSTNNSDFAIIGQGGSNRLDVYDNNAGTTRLSLNSSGNIGVGTTSPAAKLEVNGGALKVTNAGNAGIFINANAVGSDASIYFEEDDNIKAKIQHDASNDSMLFTDGAYTDTMTLKGAKVGIGTTSPISQLTVNKDVSSHNTDGITIGKVEASGWIDVNEEMGRLGWAASYGSSFTPAIGAYISAKADANWDGNEAPTRLGFFTAPVGSVTPQERLRIDSSGNIGIGTTSPAAPLVVNATSSHEGIRVQRNGESSQYISINQATGGDHVIETFGNKPLSFGVRDAQPLILKTNNTERARIDSSGRLGIGTTSPDWKLQVSGTNTQIGIESTTTGQNASLYYTANGANQWEVGTNISTGTGNYEIYDRVNNASRMFINHSGNVGIGTSSPAHKLTLAGGNFVLDNAYGVFFGDGNTGMSGRGSADTESHVAWRTNGSERARIDSSGRLIVGGTTAGETGATTIYPNGNIASSSITATGDGVFNFNKTETYNPVITANDSQSDTGQIIAVQIGGTTKGNIGISSATGNDMYIASGTTSSAGVGLRFISYQSAQYASPCRGDGSTLDNVMNLGSIGTRFDDIYATNGTIQTSDRNEKQDIQALTDAEQRVATACKGLIRRFRWQDAVEKKGDDARYHFGVIAQDLQDAFESEGLDAGDYGMFISSTWTDDDGNEQTRLGVRYNELLAFIITTL